MISGFLMAVFRYLRSVDQSFLQRTAIIPSEWASFLVLFKKTGYEGKNEEAEGVECQRIREIGVR